MTQSDGPGEPTRAGAASPMRAASTCSASFCSSSRRPLSGLYRVTSRSAGSLRLRSLRLHEARRLSYDGRRSRFTVLRKVAVAHRLAIAPVVAKASQRSLTLPAIVESDPARTVKVLPPVTGRVLELKVQLGAGSRKGDVLAIIESSDLAQALSDVEKARAALKLTKQALDRLLALEKTSAIAVKDREQAQSDYAQAQSEYAGTQARLHTIGVSADQKSDTRLLALKAPVAGSIIDLRNRPGVVPQRPDCGRDDDRRPRDRLGYR